MKVSKGLSRSFPANLITPNHCPSRFNRILATRKQAWARYEKSDDVQSLSPPSLSSFLICHCFRSETGRCLFFPQGDWHEGEYADNNRHGHGRYQWKDGRVYEGNYAHDLRDGQGMFTFRSKDVYTGSFMKGKCSGFGRVEFAGGRGYYEGEWNGGKYHGKGTLRQLCETSNGASGNNEVFVVYEGEFASGKLHGFGKKTRPDGTVEEGYWHDGVFCGDEQGMRAANAGPATILQPPDESSERSDDAPCLTSDRDVLDRESAALNERIVTLSVSIPSEDRAASASGYTV
jgi:hypothetical protein